MLSLFGLMSLVCFIRLIKFTTNRKGFLGQQLFERDELSQVMNSDYSEFCCPKCFWYFWQQKYKV